MKITLALLAATTALGFVSIPVIAAIRTSDVDSPQPALSASAETAQDGLMLIASGDGGDDDKGSADCEDDESDDDEGTCVAGSNPAPSGTVAPPANGLFGNGAAPRVQVN